MDTESFIDEIIANPLDDSLRLIFADYLEEQGDARAEMIRLQFEMKELDSHDPKWQKLRRREIKLLKAHGGFGRAPAVAKVLGTHGGFVDSVELTVARFVKLQDELFEGAPVRDLHLKSKSKKFDKVRESKWLSQLQGLSVKNNEATDDELIRLVRTASLQNLRTLSLDAVDMTSGVVSELAASPALSGLQHMALKSYRIGSGACAALCESTFVTQLRSLLLTGDQTNESLQMLAESPNTEHLEKLIVTGTWSNTGLVALQSGPYCRKLRSLTLRTHYGGPGFHDGAFLVDAPLPELRELSLGHGINDRILMQIIEGYPELEVLDLGGNLIGDAGARALAQSPLLGSLRKLTLTANQLTPAGARAIAKSPHYRKSLKLYLRSNNFPVSEVKRMKEEFGRTFGNLGQHEEWNYRYRQAGR